jgi:transposase InsO family protein
MDKDNLQEQVGLFRYGIIADFINLEAGSRGLYAQIKKKAEQQYAIPGSRRTRVAEETIRSWLKKYRKSGFEGLLPKGRLDRGKARRLPQEVQDTLLTIKEENPELTVPLVIKKARAAGQVAENIRLPESTVYKLLVRHGLTKKQAEPTKDHRRFSYQHAGELFMSDVMHGPAVKTAAGRKRKTYLIAFIDDATRVVPSAAFAYSENTAAFLEVLKQAVLRRGIPMRLFVDNGSAFRSHHLSLVCAKLGITLIHARAYSPESKGKIERWFRSVRQRFLPMLTDKELSSLAAINRALWSYVEMEYHRSPHRMLGETPLDRWAGSADRVRYPEPGLDLDDLFLFESKRKVQKDRTISLNGQVYEIEASLVGETVTLRYNPADQGETVEVRHNGRFVHKAKLVDTYANCFVKRDRPSSTLEEVEPAETAGQAVEQEQLPRHPVEFGKIAQAGKEEGHV